MTRNSLSIFNELRPYTVGFDNAFDVFERMFENDYKLNHGHNGNYPPYNIMRTVKESSQEHSHLLMM